MFIIEIDIFSRKTCLNDVLSRFRSEAWEASDFSRMEEVTLFLIPCYYRVKSIYSVYWVCCMCVRRAYIRVIYTKNNNQIHHNDILYRRSSGDILPRMKFVVSFVTNLFPAWGEFFPSGCWIIIIMNGV